MCKTCYDKGYKDYPQYSPNVTHIEDYKKGYKAKQYKEVNPGEAEHTFFCEYCYQNGKSNNKIGIWAPPLSNMRGHFESYEKGYNLVQVSDAEKVPGFLSSIEKAENENKKIVVRNQLFIALSITVIFLIIGLLFILKIIEIPKTDNLFSDTIPSNDLQDKNTNIKKNNTSRIETNILIKNKDSVAFTDSSLQNALNKDTAIVKSLIINAKENDILKNILFELKYVDDTLPAYKYIARSIVNTNKHVDTMKHETIIAKKDSTNISNKVGRYYFTALRLVTTADFSGLDKTEVSIMRNEIFARHGFIFTPGKLKDYFDHQSWYHPVTDKLEGKLSDIERQNVDFIKKYELQQFPKFTLPIQKTKKVDSSVK